ncbi:MAG: HAD family hydrolase, partial [Gammaproteobacteria bacterium]
GVLFDLDGTLLDTAPDLVYALNQLRQEHDLPLLPLSTLRPIISLGSKVMIKRILGIEENSPSFNALREKFLSLYQQHLADSTQFFPGIENVLSYLEERKIPWGIVTNKLTRHTSALLKALRLDHRPVCVICGDSLPTYKPDPAPILYACQLLQQDPQQCLYIGDSLTDVTASKAAGTTSLVALYGYIGEGENPLNWLADGYIQQPIELLQWLS